MGQIPMEKSDPEPYNGPSTLGPQFSVTQNFHRLVLTMMLLASAVGFNFRDEEPRAVSCPNSETSIYTITRVFSVLSSVAAETSTVVKIQNSYLGIWNFNVYLQPIQLVNSISLFKCFDSLMPRRSREPLAGKHISNVS